jgi:sugar phosphate isomerase/epimerase
MISQTWPRSRETNGQTLAAIETALREDFFEAFQTVEIPYIDERKALAALLAREKKPLTYCVTRVLNENRLNLSDLDEENRRRSYEQAIQCLNDARGAGAWAVSMVSGPRPQAPSDRQEALRRLGDSLAHICRAAEAAPALKVMIEPLDADADKCFTLGSTTEAITLCQQVAREGLHLWLTLDMAHILLNGEDPAGALAAAMTYAPEYHYCNPVLDASHPLRGDKHLPFGPPGAVDIADIAAVMRASLTMSYFNPSNRPGVFCEVLRSDDEDPVALMRYCRAVMLAAWEQATI